MTNAYLIFILIYYTLYSHTFQPKCEGVRSKSQLSKHKLLLREDTEYRSNSRGTWS